MRMLCKTSGSVHQCHTHTDFRRCLITLVSENACGEGLQHVDLELFDLHGQTEPCIIVLT